MNQSDRFKPSRHVRLPRRQWVYCNHATEQKAVNYLKSTYGGLLQHTSTARRRLEEPWPLTGADYDWMAIFSVGNTGLRFLYWPIRRSNGVSRNMVKAWQIEGYITITRLRSQQKQEKLVSRRSPCLLPLLCALYSKRLASFRDSKMKTLGSVLQIPPKAINSESLYLVGLVTFLSIIHMSMWPGPMVFPSFWEHHVFLQFPWACASAQLVKNMESSRRK